MLQSNRCGKCLRPLEDSALASLKGGHTRPSIVESDYGRVAGRKHQPPPAYTHDPLPNRRGCIRLLNLFSSSPNNPQIECELITIEFDERGNTDRKYEALSWCWGTAKHNSYINIRKGRKIYAKYVSPDLVSALRALRHPRVDRYLWIDAVCIDQENFLERNHQVEMMSDIYGKAEQVCIWLGDGDKASQIALNFVKKEVLQLQNFDELCESEQASSKWGALLDLMQRPWFSRRWVVQEIALARTAKIYCGTDRIAWSKFAIAVELFVEVETATHRLSEVMKKDPRFYHVPGWFEYVSALGASLLVDATGKLFRDYKANSTRYDPGPDFDSDSESNSDSDSGSDIAFDTEANSKARSNAAQPNRGQPLLSLEYLVSSLSIFEASVEHDTIYALLAIAKNTTPSASDKEEGLLLDHTQHVLEVFTQKKRYKVEYERPYVDVCKDFVQFCIERSLHSDPTRSLDVICRPWAPEEKKNVAKQNIPLWQKTNDDPVLLPSWIPQLSGAPYAMYSHAGVHTLKMGRKNADTLVGLPSLTQRNYNAAETKGIDLKTLKFRKRPKMKHYSMYVSGFILDTVAEVQHSSQSGSIPQEWAEAGGWHKAPTSNPPDEFWRTLVADRGRDGRNPPVYFSRACKESFLKGGLMSGSVNTTDLINNERCSVVAQFCRRVQAVIWNRSLIKTETKKLGLAGKNVLTEDFVCILYGCSVPVILRKSKRKTDEDIRLEIEEEICHRKREVFAVWREFHKRVKVFRAKREEEKRKYKQWENEKMIQWWKDKEWRRKWQQKLMVEKREEKIEKPMNERKVTDEPAMEREKTLEWGREFGAWKREQRQTKEWDEPKVNWGEFELCLRYGRRWKEHTRKGRLQTSKSEPTKDAKSDRTQPRTGSGEQSQSPDGDSRPETEKHSREDGAPGTERATSSRADGPSDSVPEKDPQVVSASESATAKDFQDTGASQSECLSGAQVTDSSESVPGQDNQSGANGKEDITTVKDFQETGSSQSEYLDGAQGTSLSEPAPVQGGQRGANMKVETKRVPSFPSRSESSNESHTNMAEQGTPKADAESNVEEYTENEKEVAEKIKATLSEDDYWYYEFLGECYIHGMMDGEAMAYQNNNGVRAQVFELR